MKSFVALKAFVYVVKRTFVTTLAPKGKYNSKRLNKRTCRDIREGTMGRTKFGGYRKVTSTKREIYKKNHSVTNYGRTINCTFFRSRKLVGANGFHNLPLKIPSVFQQNQVFVEIQAF